jgi:hypothetical protein
MTDIDRTSKGLRDMLFDTIEQLRTGKCEIGKARAIAAVAGQIVNTVHMEIAVANLRRDYPADTKLICPPPLQLDAKSR